MVALHQALHRALIGTIQFESSNNELHCVVSNARELCIVDAYALALTFMYVQHPSCAAGSHHWQGDRHHLRAPHSYAQQDGTLDGVELLPGVQRLIHPQREVKAAERSNN